MCTDHVDTTSSLSTIASILFFLIFWQYLHQLPYWEMCTDHVINPSRLSKKSTSCLVFFFVIFHDLFIIFAWITILGNAHRWCKQYTNIVEDGLCNATPFFSDVLGIFASITILGSVHRPCKQYLNLVNNSVFCFSWVFLIFFLSFY